MDGAANLRRPARERRDVRPLDVPALPRRATQTPARTIAIANRHPRLRLDRRAVARMMAILEANQAEIAGPKPPMPAGELSLVFLTDAALARPHADFLADPA